MSYYQKHVFFCTNQREGEKRCCAQGDAVRLRDYAKSMLKKRGLLGPGLCRVNTAGCLGRCEEGPVLVIYPDGIWCSYKTNDDVDAIIAQHLAIDTR